MLVTRHREKLINAIICFLGATKHVHTLKLFKLLNFADFEHYRQTGRTIVGALPNKNYLGIPRLCMFRP
jgi:hypothetical protein